MKKRMSSKKIIVLLVCVAVLIGAMAATGCLANDLFVDAESAQTFEVNDEINIAHITDGHYYPLNYGYNGTEEDTDFNAKLMSGTKLFLESSMMNLQMLKQIEAESPDYLLVTGDITLDGEIQGHIEYANLLRQLQNTIRASGNEEFQVFVSFGNHDMYNPNVYHYRDGGAETPLSRLSTRYDMTKIYSSLGYPDLDDSEIEEYYDTLTTDVFFDNLPYDGNYINSSTAEGINIEYQYADKPLNANNDYDNGDITYVAFTDDGYVFISVDEEAGSHESGYQTGGNLYNNTKEYLRTLKSEGKFDDKKNIFGLLHHNIAPHFPMEETLLKDFTIYAWLEVADFLADEIGVKYAFTGHMHANDIATRISFGGNPIHDMETASVTGYKGGARFAKIQAGTINGDYAENLYTRIELLGDTDFTPLYNGYLNDDYLNFFNLNKYIEKRGDAYFCINASDYAADKLFRNVVKNLFNTYLQPSFINGLGDFIVEMLGDSDDPIMTMVSGFAGPLIKSIIIHYDEVVLAGYEYKGSNPAYMTDERGAKLCGYIEDMVYSVLDMEVNQNGDKLFDVVIGGYLAHVGGLDTSLADADPNILEALENFKNGSIIQDFVDLILNEEVGLLRIVKGLLLPIDLTKGMQKNQIPGLNILLKAIGPENADATSFKVDEYLVSIEEKLGIDIGLSLGDQTLSEYLDELLGTYLPQSFIMGFGEIGYDILSQFYIDETAAYETSFDDFVLYKHNTTLPVTNLSTAAPEAPSIENGKLPSMLTVTFGADPKTEKNFVWFTDRRVEGTQIQYSEGAFDANTATTVTGDFEVYATTTASIDLIIYFQLMYRQVGRHTVEISGLKPGTTYSYRVGSAADNYWSDVYTLTTAPADNASPFELLLITDIQGSVRRPYEAVQEMLANMGEVFPNGYDFVINTGDIVDNSRSLAQWEYLLNFPAEYWRNTTQVISIGNHEAYAFERDELDEIDELMLTEPNLIQEPYNYFLKHYNFSYPEQDDLRGAYYSFDYSGVHFTVLDTNSTGANGLVDSQIEWLINDLESTDKLKVVLMHRGIYTAGIHSTDGNIERTRKQLTPIFADYGVSVVFQGHDHVYSESYYLDRDGKPVNLEPGTSKIRGDGVLHITLGCFGDKYYGYTPNEDVPIEFGKIIHNPALANPTFGKLVFDGTDLYYYGYDYNLETGEIRVLRDIKDDEPKNISEEGLLWWHWVLIAIGGAAVLVGGAFAALHITKCKKCCAKKRQASDDEVVTDDANTFDSEVADMGDESGVDEDA